MMLMIFCVRRSVKKTRLLQKGSTDFNFHSIDTDANLFLVYDHLSVTKEENYI